MKDKVDLRELRNKLKTMRIEINEYVCELYKERTGYIDELNNDDNIDYILIPLCDIDDHIKYAITHINEKIEE